MKWTEDGSPSRSVVGLNENAFYHNFHIPRLEKSSLSCVSLSIYFANAVHKILANHPSSCDIYLSGAPLLLFLLLFFLLLLSLFTVL